MTVWLAGMQITADRLNDNSLDASTVSGLTAASGFSVSSFSGRKVNGITTVQMFVTRTGADIAQTASDSGNISPDTTVCTLPVGWRPPETINCICGNGSVDGEATISTIGGVVLRSVSGNSGWASGTNLRFTAMWISEND